MGTWIIAMLAFFGVMGAVIAFFQTSSERRYKFRGALHVSLEEQLKDCSANAQAVIIKSNKKLWLARNSALMLLGTLLFGISVWQKNAATHECATLLGLNTKHVSLLLACYVIPIAVFVGSLFFFRTGVKTIKTGYYPPLDSIVFVDTITKKGLLSSARGFILMTLPFLALFIIHLGNNA